MNKIATLITKQTIDSYIIKEKDVMIKSLNLIDQYIKNDGDAESIINIYTSIISRFNIFSAKLINLLENINKKDNIVNNKNINNNDNDEVLPQFEL